MKNNNSERKIFLVLNYYF